MQLIADSGSTKTNWVVLDKQEVMASCSTSGFNPHYLSVNDISGGLRNELLPGLKDLAPAIKEIWFYGAGCSGELVNNKITESLSEIFPQAESSVDSDLLAAARSLCDSQPGIACILGTGSNSCQFDGKVIIEHIPPLGFLFGDDGSGAELGRLLVKAYFQKDLGKEVAERFELTFGKDRSSVLNRVYDSPTPNRELAGFATFVAANLDFPEIYTLAEESFSLFFKSAVCKYSSYKDYPVHFTGSIAYHFDQVLTRVIEKNGLRKGKITRDPMEGLIRFHQKS